MAKLNTGFDVGGYAPREARSLLPRGQYLLEVLSVEDKKTRTGGTYLDIGFRVVGSPEAKLLGARLRQNLNLPPAGDDEKAETQRRMFAQFWKAVEPKATGMVLDTDDWAGKKIVADVDHEHGTFTSPSTGEEIATAKSKISTAFPEGEWHGGFLKDQCKACAAATARAVRPKPATAGAETSSNGQPPVFAGGDPELGDDIM